MGAAFLLDEHFSPAVIEIVARLDPNITVHAVSTFQEGELRGESDEGLLTYCHEHALVLVTADLATIPALLREWADKGKEHGGVVFVSHKSIRTHDHRRIAMGLVQLGQQAPDWINAVYFMTTAGERASDPAKKA